MSFFFYAYWHPPYVILLVISTVVDFYIGKKIFHTIAKNKRKLFLLLSLFINLGLLSYFKYADFFRESLNNLLLLANIHWEFTSHPFGIVLPIGISFYTFQTMSYSIDMYRKRIKPCKSLKDFAIYVSFFPQLIAGPIIRFEEFEDFRKKPAALGSYSQISLGLVYIALGVFKKVIISDNISWWIDNLFKGFSIQTHGIFLWIGAILFGVQIYCDFSGYSDIAIGLGRICGIDLPDNFNNPYFSKNITDFWKRWHMTLSRWLKDYLYIPLGGNRKGTLRTYINLMITMLLGGLWHGASWNFVIWGGIQGLGLTVHKVYQNSRIKKIFSKIPMYSFLAWGVTIIFICISWLIFRISDTSNLFVCLKLLFQGDNFGTTASLRGSQIKIVIPYFVMFLMYEVVMLRTTKEKLAQKIIHYTTPVLCLYSFLFGFFITCFLPGNKAPFIYFQF